jgi:hypothetical protein
MYDTEIMLNVVKDKKSSHESIINLTQNVPYEIGIFPILAKLSKAYFRDNCEHSKCYAFSRKNKCIFASTPRKPDCIFPVRCEGR